MPITLIIQENKDHILIRVPPHNKAVELSVPIHMVEEVTVREVEPDWRPARWPDYPYYYDPFPYGLPL